MSSVLKYVDIDSSYRNRNLYPNPADFVIPVSNGPNNALNAAQAQSAIANAYPIDIGTTQAGSTTTQIVLSATDSTINNFYIGKYLQIGTQFSVITAYDGATQTATVNQPFSVAPPAGTTYYVRAAIPMLSSNLIAGSTQTVLNLGPSASTVNQIYQGAFIYFTSGPNQGDSALIVNYNGTTQQATLGSALPQVPGATDAYDILQYSSDSYSPLIYSGTLGFGQPVCYSIELIHLTVPNQTMASGYGGTLNNYPYLLLQFYNEGNKHADKVIYSNNPNEQTCLFKIPLGLNLSHETFFTLKDCRMIQVAKHKLDQPLRFRLTLPDGSPIIFATADNVPPESVNPFVQISASFAFRRIDGSLSAPTGSGQTIGR
jgi:hypothetical protein